MYCEIVGVYLDVTPTGIRWSYSTRYTSNSYTRYAWRVRLDARGTRAQAAKNRVIVVPNWLSSAASIVEFPKI